MVKLSDTTSCCTKVHVTSWLAVVKSGQREIVMSTIEQTYSVSGMHCAACSSRIERVVSQMEGIDSAQVNLAAEKMTCRFDQSITGFNAIAERVAALGFKLEEQEGELSEIVYDISGMHCASCSSRIEKVLRTREGIVSAEVNLATEKAVIQYDRSLIHARRIRETIEGLGFTARQSGAGTDEFSRKRLQTIEQLRRMRQDLFVSLGFAALLFYVAMGEMLGFPLPEIIHPSYRPFAFAFVQFCLVLPIMYMGRQFYLVGIPALARKSPNMDSLIAVGTGAAFIYSAWGLVEIGMGINVHQRVMDLYFESAGVLIALVSLGKYFESRSKYHTSDAISQLVELTPDSATLLDGTEQREVATDEIEADDILLIKPGERLPVDGVVVQGTSVLDESMLTGESLPVEKQKDSQVYGGTLNQTGVLQVRATETGSDTVLSRIIRMVQEAQGSKAPIAALADRISLYFVPIVMGLALFTGLTWYFIGDVEFSLALRFFIAVLVIACPCAMGLATPTSIMVGTGRGAQLGVLIKNGEALQRAETIETVIFDKTGTLTSGKPSVTDYIPLASKQDGFEAISLAASVEQSSEHPLAEAIVAYAKSKGAALVQPESFTMLSGAGISADVSGHEVLVGNRRILEAHDIHIPEEIGSGQTYSSAGKTVLYVAVDQKLSGLIAIADQLKPEAPGCVLRLKGMKLEVAMLTGDHPVTAEAIARQAGIEKIFAQVLPDEKRGKVEEVQKRGRRVAMVGDGINDAPALAQADIGIAMGSGTDIAIESGDIVIMNSNLDGVITALALSRAVMRNIRQNLFWAFAYNVVGIPVAAGLLHIFGGPVLNPMLAGGAMALSSVSVVGNALRLRFFQG